MQPRFGSLGGDAAAVLRRFGVSVQMGGVSFAQQLAQKREVRAKGR
jgi:hypothetical protein